MLVWRAWATPNQTPWPDDLNSDTTFCGKYQQSSGPNNSYPPFLFIQMFFFLILTFLVYSDVLLPQTHLSWLSRSSSSSYAPCSFTYSSSSYPPFLFIQLFFFLIHNFLVHPLVLHPHTHISCSSRCSSSSDPPFLNWFLLSEAFLREAFTRKKRK